MSPLLREEEIDAMDSGNESDHDIISTDMLEDISDKYQSHPKINKIEACYKIRYCIRKRQSEWKRALRFTQNMGKGLHKLFKNVMKDISQEFPPLGESVSEVSHFITESTKFAKLSKLSDDKKKPWLQATLK